MFAVLFGLSLLMDPQGFLGTDTGGKVATLATMQANGTWTDPDVGYWAAAWDPSGRVHGLIYTAHLGEKWVNVTSLPMLLAGGPLWRLGGYRAVIVLPILGAVACAFVARGFARRLRGGEGWAAFWLVGLASPIAVYALDFWEHTIGAALIGGGLLVVLVAVLDPARWWRGLMAGLLFGAAFSMRTEAVVYAVVGVAVAGGALVWSRRAWVAAGVFGATAVAGFSVVVVVNGVVERSLLGTTFRSGRALGAATTAVADSGSVWVVRAREALITSVTPFPTSELGFGLLGLLLAGALVACARAARPQGERRLAIVSAAVAGLLVFLRLSYGLGFWPGLVATTPLAGAALALGWARREERLVLALALAPLPLVFATQFTGGAVPQWGGRYILTSALLLAAVGAGVLPDLLPWARRGFVLASVVATAAGLVWLSVRSHDVATAGALLDARTEQVLISRDGFPAREFGATYGKKQWLALANSADLEYAVGVAAASGARTFAVVELDGDRPMPSFPGFRQAGRDTVAFIAGEQFTIVTFERD